MNYKSYLPPLQELRLYVAQVSRQLGKNVVGFDLREYLEVVKKTAIKKNQTMAVCGILGWFPVSLVNFIFPSPADSPLWRPISRNPVSVSLYVAPFFESPNAICDPACTLAMLMSPRD